MASAAAYNRPMVSRWLIAVRFVLSVCLVLNGLGTGGAAHAHNVLPAESRQAERAGPVGATTTTEAGSSGVSEKPCHGVEAPPLADEPPSDPVSSDAEDRLPSCCDLAGCGGACLQHPPGAISSWASTTSLPRVARAAALRSLHSAPELPHLTRPPIS